MATGGTAYPGNSGNPGAPGVANPGGSAQGGRGNKVPGGEKRYWNGRSGKMETAQQIKNYKPPAATRQPAAARALGAPGHARTPAAKPAAVAKSPYLGEQIADPLGLLSRATKQKTAYGINEAEGAERQTALRPFQQKNAEIVNTQGNVSQRLGQINQSNANYLGGLLGGAEGAKTANNYAAESALSAQRSVETAGQNAPTNVGGILASNLGATEQRGEANAQAMRMLAASAAARGQEEQGLANTRFATEAAKNRAGENATLEKISNKAKNERLEYALKVYPDIIAQNKLASNERIQGAKLAQGAEGINIKKGQLGINAANSANKRAGELEKNATGRANAETNRGKLGVAISKLGIEKANEESNAEYRQHKGEVESMNARNRGWWYERQAEYKTWQKQHPKQSTTGNVSARKHMGEISQVEAKIRSKLGGSAKEQAVKARSMTPAERASLGKEKGFSTELISAGLNLIGYGRLSRSDQQSAIGWGINPTWNPNWFRTQ